MALISLRGDGGWKGRSTRNPQERGQRFQRRVVNGYVSADSDELRAIPGWRVLVDLSAQHNADGYRRLAIDTIFPVVEFLAGNLYDYDGTSDARLTLQCRADELHIHGFEQIRGQLVLFGESHFRKTPIYTSARAECTVVGVEIAAGGEWVLTLSATPGSYSNSDLAAGFHGLSPGNLLFVENVIVGTGDVTQAQVDATLNDRFHPVKSISGATVTLTTIPSGLSASASTTSADGEVHKTRANAANVYPTPDPISPWEPSQYRRIDDPPALTTWTVRDPLTLTAPSSLKATAAWVANRQRDWGDDNGAGNDFHSPILGVPNFVDGVLVPGSTPGMGRGWSRRRQKSLPYRVNPEVAGDRLLFAAPGYLCVFQAPLMLPIEPEGWPTPPESWSPGGGVGLSWPANDVYDKPRVAGIPKAVLIESLVFTPNYLPGGSGAPSPATSRYNFATGPTPSSPLWPAGLYKIRVSYVDEATGEEGLASDPISIAMPATGNSIRLWVVHPGYIMPECLARRVNVYLAPPGGDAYGYYTTVQLSNTAGVGIESYSAKYGARGAVSPDAGRIWVNIELPSFGSPISAAIDFTRPAPDNGHMPRGAESVRYIRGTLVSVGHSGTHGRQGELLRSRMTADYSRTSTSLVYGCSTPNEVHVRGFRAGLVAQATPSGPTPDVDGPFGVGGNFFPSGYQGVPIFSKDLIGAPVQRFEIERIKNVGAYSDSGGEVGSPFVSGASRDLAMRQRLATRSDIRARVGAPEAVRKGREVFVVLPKGQVQTGDPGRPGAVTATNIQFLDSRKDDDGLAIGTLGGQAVICSRRETYYLAWTRDPAGNTPQLIHDEIGCIAANSMANFDGGLAWLDSRGPVAMTSDGVIQRLGQLEHDFSGVSARYAVDSKGLMRHAWGAHDAQRGLVYWGLVTTDSTHQVDYQGASAAFASHGDEARSRFPCNEILIWSYRANAFSVWQPPAGMEVLWMRPLQLGDGTTRMCFLAADKRIYVMDDQWSDSNATPFTAVAGETKTNSTELYTANTWGFDGQVTAEPMAMGNFVRVGMPVVIHDDDGEVTAVTSVAALDPDTWTITLADACSWKAGWLIHIGVRPEMRVEFSYIGAGEAPFKAKAVHVRYMLEGTGTAHMQCTALVTDLSDSVTEAGMTESPQWQRASGGSSLSSTTFSKVGQRRVFEEGFPTSFEMAVNLRCLTSASLRLSDVIVETVDE